MIMKLALTLLTAFLFLSGASATAREYPGYIIHLNGDTVECTLLSTVLDRLVTPNGTIINKGWIRTRLNGTTTSYTTDQLRGYGLRIVNEWRHLRAVQLPGLFGPTWMEERVTGPLRLYTMVTYDPLGYLTARDWVAVYDHATDRLHFDRAQTLGSRKRLLDFLPPCPALERKFEAGDFRTRRLDDWPAIIEFHNEQCGGDASVPNTFSAVSYRR